MTANDLPIRKTNTLFVGFSRSTYLSICIIFVNNLAFIETRLSVRSKCCTRMVTGLGQSPRWITSFGIIIVHVLIVL